MKTQKKSSDTPLAVSQRYHCDGYDFPVGEVPPAMVSNAARKIEYLLDNPPQDLQHPWALKAQLLFDWIYDLTVHPAVLDAVESVVGTNILMPAADMFAKRGNSIKQVNWHQDANYWHLEPFEICTAWIALTDAFPENGCMRFMPGTHLNDKIEHKETFAQDSQLTRGQEIAVKFDENKAVPVILNAGQISLHHCMLAHASGPNTTDRPRIGLAVRYMSTQMRQTKGPPMSAILVRGEDDYGHFGTDTPPQGDLDASSIEAHARSMAPHAPQNYATA